MTNKEKRESIRGEWEKASFLFHILKTMQSSQGIEAIIAFSKGKFDFDSYIDFNRKDRCDFCGIYVQNRKVDKLRTCMSKECRKKYLCVNARETYNKCPERSKAIREVRKALKEGVLTRNPCETCGDPETQGHHPDYSKPLEVNWLCRKHHQEVHNVLRKEKKLKQNIISR